MKIEKVKLEKLIPYARNSRTHSDQQMTDEKVLPIYQMDGSMFTSGIVNHNNPLKYHFDSGNYVGVWSAMSWFPACRTVWCY